MFKGDYLRVLTPITSDGVQLAVVDGQVQYREDHLPLTARKTLERKNAKLPESLRKKIEVVSNAPYKPQEVSQEIKKGGRPKKNA